MDGLVAVVVVGLVLALLAALWVIRRRTDELDALRLESLAEGSPTTAARPGDPTPAARRSGLDLVEDLLPVGVVQFDESRRVQRANPRAHALLGVGPGRLTGRTVMESFLDERTESLINGVPEGGSATGELLARAGEPTAGDGDRRVLIVRAHRPAGSGTLVVLEDVTELRRLEQIRSEFIDNVSHELRTPLSTVLLLAETLARDAEGAEVPARMRERIAKVEVETGHLVQMVNELLDLARIEGGTQLRLDDDVSVGRLAEASVERLRLFAERQGVTLVTEIEPDLPMVRGNEERLGQVVVNLVHNAVKFSPDGGEVRIVARLDDGRVRVSVIDHGIGISSIDQARIFERFYKADRARVRGGGTGLGLSIARHVVEGHGGQIWVDSEEGRGSTFSFAIPVAQGADQATTDGQGATEVGGGLTAPGRRSARLPDPAVRTLRLAHRGDARVAPENSLEALVLAIGVPGCDGVELDVRLSRDGVPVLLHDASLERVQGRAASVRELDAVALRELGIPSLADVLAALPDDAFLDIELKGEGHGAATATVLRTALGRAPDRAVVSSFDPATLSAMRRRLPGWDRWLNVEDLDPAALATASELGCSAVASGWRSITAARVRHTRAAGLDVAAWTVRRAGTFDRLAALGVIACCVEGEALDAGAAEQASVRGRGTSADPARG